MIFKFWKEKIVAGGGGGGKYGEYGGYGRTVTFSYSKKSVTIRALCAGAVQFWGGDFCSSSSIFSEQRLELACDLSAF